MHPSLERSHSNCLNLTIKHGRVTKVSGLGIAGYIQSWGYFSTTTKGNHVRVALPAHKKKSSLQLWFHSTQDIEHRANQLHGIDGRALEKSFCRFGLTLACNSGYNTSVHHQQAWGCLWLHWGWAGPEPFRKALGRMGSFRVWQPKDSGTHSKC